MADLHRRSYAYCWSIPGTVSSVAIDRASSEMLASAKSLARESARLRDEGWDATALWRGFAVGAGLLAIALLAVAGALRGRLQRT